MKSTPIKIYSGVAFIDEEYISIKKDGTALDLSSYDLQMQILDVDDNYAVLMTPTVTKDSGTDGRLWPTFTAAQSTALADANATWVLLMRPSDLTQDPRLIGFGPIVVRRGASWQ